jgi:hypothetical protein
MRGRISEIKKRLICFVKKKFKMWFVTQNGKVTEEQVCRRKYFCRRYKDVSIECESSGKAYGRNQNFTGNLLYSTEEEGQTMQRRNT